MTIVFGCSLTKLPGWRARRSLSLQAPALRCAPKRGLTTAKAQAAPMTAYVKGAGGKLGDCPFSHKVLLTLEAKGMPYKTSLIDLANKPSWLQEKSGGKVPVVQLGEDGEWVADSDVIVKRLEKLQPQPSMASAVPPQVGAGLFSALKGYLTCSAQDAEQKRSQLEAELAAVEQALAAHASPLFGGAQLNASDAAVSPFLYHAVTACKHFKTFDVPARYPAIAGYMSALKAHPAWQAVDYGEQEIIHGWNVKIAAAAKQ